MEQNNLFKEYKDVFNEEEEKPKTKKEKVFDYSPFALQDAIGEKNTKKAWIEYERLRFSNIEAEELIHKIAAKIRDLLAIKLGANKNSLFLKDYPYSKSKKDTKNWEIKELENIYTKIITTYHSSRMDKRSPIIENTFKGELDLVLEKLILSI